MEKVQKLLKLVVSEDRPLNPPILGDFELKKVVNSPQSWWAGGAKNFGSQTGRTLLLERFFSLIKIVF
jgi:hypothetical protein